MFLFSFFTAIRPGFFFNTAFVGRSLDSTVSEDAWIEPGTVATFVFAVALTTWLDQILDICELWQCSAYFTVNFSEDARDVIACGLKLKGLSHEIDLNNFDKNL
jgi:hypothetical protein